MATAEAVQVFSPTAFMDAMRNAGYSAQEFAAEMGLHPNTIAGWIIGGSRPRAAMLPAIAKRLGVTVADLMEKGKGDRRPNRSPFRTST
jgi:transcriptional regulator with XRE-family HTH domain